MSSPEDDLIRLKSRVRYQRSFKPTPAATIIHQANTGLPELIQNLVAGSNLNELEGPDEERDPISHELNIAVRNQLPDSRRPLVELLLNSFDSSVGAPGTEDVETQFPTVANIEFFLMMQMYSKP